MIINTKYDIGDVLRFKDYYNNIHYGAVVAIKLKDDGKIWYETSIELDKGNNYCVPEEYDDEWDMNISCKIGHDDTYPLL